MVKSQHLEKVELRKLHSNQQSKKESYTKRKKNRVRKCNFQWTSEATMILIENVHKFENLWNPSYILYRDRQTHQKSWERIAESLCLPKQEVIVKWNSLRSNYRIYLKNRRGNTNAREGKQRNPHRFFVAMSFLDPVLKIDAKIPDFESFGKITKTENDRNNEASSGFQGLKEADSLNTNPIQEDIIKDETCSLKSEENLPSVSQTAGNSPQNDSRTPILLHKKVNAERIWQRFNNQNDNPEEESDDDFKSLRKTKLKLEIYNLQLDAVKKEIDLGLERSYLTAELYENWDVPTLGAT